MKHGGVMQVGTVLKSVFSFWKFTDFANVDTIINGQRLEF